MQYLASTYFLFLDSQKIPKTYDHIGVTGIVLEVLVSVGPT